MTVKDWLESDKGKRLECEVRCISGDMKINSQPLFLMGGELDW